MDFVSLFFVGTAALFLLLIEFFIFGDPELEDMKRILPEIHLVVYALVALGCRMLLKSPFSNLGIQIVLYFSLSVCLLVVVILCRRYGLFLFIGRIRYAFCGLMNNGKKMQYQIAYKDGTTSDTLNSIKAKRGVIWAYEGKNYLVDLYDRNVSEKKAPIQKEKLLLAAARDTNLQSCLVAAGGRPIGRGIYYCIGTPSIVEDATLAVALNRKGEIKEGFLYEDEVPRALTRKITLVA